MTNLRLTLGAVVGRGVSPCALAVVVTSGRRHRLALLRGWPAGTPDAVVVRAARRLAKGRRPVVAARPADADRLGGLGELEAPVVPVEVADASLALRLRHLLVSTGRMRVRVGGGVAGRLGEELLDFPSVPGELALAVALAAWLADQP